MKKDLSNKTANRVLIFNPLKRLVGIYSSLTSTALIHKASNSAIHQACIGPSISCKGFYFRFLSPEIEIEPSDYGKLRLEDYDKMCGVERQYYPTAKMCRLGMKYKNHPKHTK